MSPIQPYRNILLTFFHLLLYCLELIKPLVSGFHIFILLSHEPEAIILLSPLKKTDKTLSECRCKVLKKRSTNVHADLDWEQVFFGDDEFPKSSFQNLSILNAYKFIHFTKLLRCPIFKRIWFNNVFVAIATLLSKLKLSKNLYKISMILTKG